MYRFVVIFGVAGGGKSTVGKLLAHETGWPFFDADDYHPPENVRKMADGTALDDADREPWLAELSSLIASTLAKGQNGILACSALKQTYRDRLAVDERVQFIYLKADKQTISERLRRRTGHFMPPTLIDSQFAALEEPREGSVVDAADPPEVLVRAIAASLGVGGQ